MYTVSYRGHLVDALMFWMSGELTPCLGVIVHRQRARTLAALGAALNAYRCRGRRIALASDSDPAQVRRRVFEALARGRVPVLNLEAAEPGACFLLARLVQDIGTDAAATRRRALLVLPATAAPWLNGHPVLKTTYCIDGGH